MKVNNKLEILNILKNTTSFTSGEIISKRLNISRTAVWKNIRSLTELGYKILKEPVGYKLELEDDLILPYEFNEEYNLFIYKKTSDSTMKLARDLISKGNYNPWSIILSESQSAGRSKDGSLFKSPIGGIYFTMIIDTDLGINSVNLYPMAGLIAVYEELKSIIMGELTLKWPFEFWLDNKKIGGILHDYETQSNKILWLTLGIGLNITLLRKELIKNIKNRIILLLENPQTVLDNYIKTIDIIGKNFTIHMDNEEFKGIIKSIDKLGTITLETNSGQEFIYIGNSSLKEEK